MACEIPYQPMGRKVCTTTVEQMTEKLARRCEEIAEKRLEVKVDVPAPVRDSPAISDARPRLVWRKVSDWCIESACGGYRIEKFVADSAGMHCPAAVRFRCLKRNPEFFWHFDTTNDAQEARKRCEGQLNAQHG